MRLDAVHERGGVGGEENYSTVRFLLPLQIFGPCTEVTGTFLRSSGSLSISDLPPYSLVYTHTQTDRRWP